MKVWVGGTGRITENLQSPSWGLAFCSSLQQAFLPSDRHRYEQIPPRIRVESVMVFAVLRHLTGCHCSCIYRPHRIHLPPLSLTSLWKVGKSRPRESYLSMKVQWKFPEARLEESTHFYCVCNQTENCLGTQQDPQLTTTEVNSAPENIKVLRKTGALQL